MEKRKIINTSIILILFLYTLFNRFFLLKNYLKYAEFISAAFMILITSLSIYLYGFKKSRNTKLEKEVVSISRIVIIIYFVIIYGIGVFAGFLKNAYSLKFFGILNNIFSPIIIAICIELLRYIFLEANKNHNKSIVLITIAIILLDLSINMRVLDFSSKSEIFKIITSMGLPIIIKNMVFTYVSNHIGYKIPIIYRLFVDMYIFIVPILPNISEYIISVLGICIPFTLYLLSNRLIELNEKGIEYNYRKKAFSLTDVPFILLIIILAYLISGYFKYSIIGIGSESMTGKINKGDAVIVMKVKSEKDFKKGDIITYEYNGKTIVHRLVEIKEENGKKKYITKGDANITEDNVDLYIDDIKGVVKLRFPYIAYPSILLLELFS